MWRDIAAVIVVLVVFAMVIVDAMGVFDKIDGIRHRHRW